MPGLLASIPWTDPSNSFPVPQLEEGEGPPLLYHLAACQSLV